MRADDIAVMLGAVEWQLRPRCRLKTGLGSAQEPRGMQLAPLYAASLARQRLASGRGHRQRPHLAAHRRPCWPCYGARHGHTYQCGACQSRGRGCGDTGGEWAYQAFAPPPSLPPPFEPQLLSGIVTSDAERRWNELERVRAIKTRNTAAHHVSCHFIKLGGVLLCSANDNAVEASILRKRTAM
jgi:hypothetical protein